MVLEYHGTMVCHTVPIGTRVRAIGTMVRDRLTHKRPANHPWNPQTRTVLREAMQALVRRAGPHAIEDCGGDPRCRHRCRVGTAVYCGFFYADNAHEFPRSPLHLSACVSIVVFEIMINVRTRVHVYVHVT
jgi:hypothetical protein